MRKYLKLEGPFAASSASQAVRHGQHIYISGLIGLDHEGKLVDGGVAAETRAALADGERVLEKFGASLRDVVSATAFLLNFSSDYADFSQAYAKCFDVEGYPARVSVGVSELAMNARVELQLVAMVDES